MTLQGALLTYLSTQKHTNTHTDKPTDLHSGEDWGQRGIRSQKQLCTKGIFSMCFPCKCGLFTHPSRWKIGDISSNIVSPKNQKVASNTYLDFFLWLEDMYWNLIMLICLLTDGIILYTNCWFLQFLFCGNDYHQVSVLCSWLQCSKFNLRWLPLSTSPFFLSFCLISITFVY